LRRQICLQFADDEKVLHVLTIRPELEQMIIDSRVDTATGAVAGLEPEVHRKWIQALTNSVKNIQDQGFSPVILCSEAARPLVKSSTRRDLPDLAVLSVPELVSDVKIESLGEITI